MTWEEFLNGFNRLAVLFEVPKYFSDRSLEAYHAAISELTADQFSDAIDTIVRSERSFPMPCDVLKYAGVETSAIANSV